MSHQLLWQFSWHMHFYHAHTFVCSLEQQWVLLSASSINHSSPVDLVECWLFYVLRKEISKGSFPQGRNLDPVSYYNFSSQMSFLQVAVLLVFSFPQEVLQTCGPTFLKRDQCWTRRHIGPVSSVVWWWLCFLLSSGQFAVQQGEFALKRVDLPSQSARPPSRNPALTSVSLWSC